MIISKYIIVETLININLKIIYFYFKLILIRVSTIIYFEIIIVYIIIILYYHELLNKLILI